MLDIKEELKRFKPILEVDDIEDSLVNNEVHDLLEILCSIDNKIDKKPVKKEV